MAMNMRKGALVVFGLSLLAGTALLMGATRSGPVVIGVDGEVHHPVVQDLGAQAPLEPLVFRDGKWQLNLSNDSVVVVVRDSAALNGVFGMKILPQGEKTEQDVLDAVAEVYAYSPTPHSVSDGFFDLEKSTTLLLPLEEGTGDVHLLNTAEAVVLAQSDDASPQIAVWPWPQVQLATFRKVCPAGCQWPEDAECCTILGCSGSYRDCVIWTPATLAPR